ncbi:MAG TPA: hypothetical protein VF950_19575 [Planctomycetota bacterium]
MDEQGKAPGGERLAGLAEKALTKPEEASAPPRIGPLSKGIGIAGAVAVAVGIALLCLVHMTSLAEKPKVGGPLQSAGLLGILVGPFLMIKLIYDLNKPSVAQRSQPAMALRAYLLSVRCGWWSGAAACLSWSAKEGSPARRQELPALDLDAIEVPIHDPSDLRDYWGGLLGGGRELSIDSVKAEPAGDDRAMVRGTLTVTIDLNKAGARAREGGRLIRNKNEVTFSGAWCAYRRDGLWYLLEAGLPEGTRIDRKA